MTLSCLGACRPKRRKMYSTRSAAHAQLHLCNVLSTPSFNVLFPMFAHDGLHNRVQVKAPSKAPLLSKRTTMTIVQTRTWCGTRSGTNLRGGTGERCVSLHSHHTSFVAIAACMVSFVFWFLAHIDGSLLYLRGQSEWRGR
jgi:hypothetical protein